MNQKLNALEYRIGTLEAYLDCEPNAPADDSPCTIHELIADEMTGVTADAYSRIDAVSGRLSIWEQWAAKQEKRIDDTLNYVAERIEALEKQNALLNRQAH
jgi:BMFP domain-containing protein YqiC